jgi:ATP-dependent helicase YprA (DUF1998 family)
MCPPTASSEALSPQNPSRASQVHQFTEDELDEIDFRDLGQKNFGKTPFDWQIEAAKAILRGDDVILDVGTGNGKSLSFLALSSSFCRSRASWRAAYRLAFSALTAGVSSMSLVRCRLG